MKNLYKIISSAWVLLPLALVAAVAAWSYLPVDRWINGLHEWVGGLGAWGVIAFVLIGALATIALMPAIPLEIAAGVIFKFWGFPIALLSGALGGIAAFLIARYLLRHRVEQMIEGRPRFRAVNHAVDAYGWRVVAVARMSPLLPLNLQNYFFGVTKVLLWRFALATVLGMIPGTAIFVYLGSIGAAAKDGGVLVYTLIGGGLLATVLVAWTLTRKTRALLEKEAGAD